MPDQIPQEFPTPDRNEVIDDFKRDTRFYSNGSFPTDEGSLADVDARTLADQIVPAYQQNARSAENLVLRRSTGKAAEEWALSRGLPGRTAATGSIGYVTITAATGGTTLFAGDELKFLPSGLRYECLRDDTYFNGKRVPVRALDTGPATNLPPGSKVIWTAPRPGCGAEATVWADPDGQGLIGGRAQETDAEIIERVVETGRTPPATGNDAHLQRLVKDAGVALGIPVQQAYTYPCAMGAATTCVVFTLLPDAPGGSRIPSDEQINAIEAWVKSALPGEDGLFFASLATQATDLALRVQWRAGASSWADLVPWPALYTGASALVVQAVTDALHFTVGKDGGYSGVAAPTVGKTIGVYDPSAQTFRRKRLSGVSGTGPWVLTFDATNEASDATYTPVVGQRVCPWSDSLDLVVPPLLAEFDLFGPGEQTSSFFDEGSRQRRQPPALLRWPSRLGARAINGVQDLAAVADAQLAEPLPSSLPLDTTVGVLGTLSYLRTLRYLAAFPL